MNIALSARCEHVQPRSVGSLEQAADRLSCAKWHLLLLITSAFGLAGCGGGTSEVVSPPAVPISVGPQEAFEREAFELELPDVLFADVRGGTPVVSLSGSPPSWLLLSNRKLTGTPPEGSRGTYQILLEKRDTNGATSVTSFALRVGLQHERYFTFVDDGFPPLFDFYSEVKALWSDSARGVNVDPLFFDGNGDRKLDLLLNVCRFTDPASNITGPSFCRARYLELGSTAYTDLSAQKLSPFPINLGGGIVYFGAEGDFNRDGKVDLLFGTGREDGRPKGEGGASQGSWAGDTWSLMSSAANKLEAVLATPVSVGTNALRAGAVIPSLGEEHVLWFQSDQASDGSVNPNRYAPFGGYALRWTGATWQLLSGAPNVANFPILIAFDQAGLVSDQGTAEKVIIAPNSGFNAVVWTREGFQNGFHAAGNPLGAIAVSSRNGSPFAFREMVFSIENPPVQVQKGSGASLRTAEVWRHKGRTYVDAIFEESCRLRSAPNQVLAVFRVGTTQLPQSYTGGPLPDEAVAPSGFYKPISLYFAYEYRGGRLVPVDLGLTTDDATYQLECNDINGDGFDDISLQGFRVDGRPLVFLNNGQGRFSGVDFGRLPPLPPALQWTPKSGENHKVFFRDVNADGIMDMISIQAVFVDPANWRQTGLKPLLYLGRRRLAN